MKKTLTMKVLFVILAALAPFSAALINRQYSVARETRKAKVAAQLEHDRQQVRMDDDDYSAQAADEQKRFNEQVEAIRKKVHAYAGNESKTLTNLKP
jgi:membrane protein implicated in regulation of membrane protease activity